ncbi:GNAT family N-acetyltransferase [Gloeobacter violaceus]|uniref:Gll0241 protein n=1 Tax=Gloeobacter violaceus (strain ATCC 29082 / PCC 7421) TaxID=251221 RepID=Q7NP17_GLOVI|nr:GNAT family N-acetyltransferase [Gloeobacter violaceus]BAC88182.1 gll0241 [Gloeobacter violaceus PCC 7421]
MIDIAVKLLGPGDEVVLEGVALEVFDGPVDPALVRAFLAEPGHYIVVAVDGGTVVGFASGVRYLHPDKPWALWVNEVGVSPDWQGRGIGKAVLRCLLEAGAAAGCTEAWVGTEAGNAPARALYRAVGGALDSEAFVTFSFPLGCGSADPEQNESAPTRAENPGVDCP